MQDISFDAFVSQIFNSIELFRKTQVDASFFITLVTESISAFDLTIVLL